MASKFLATVLILSTVAGCARVADSRLNPLNWFGRSERQSVEVTVDPYADTRPLVGQVISLNIEHAPGGAIIRATGLAPRQGFFDGELVPVNDERPDGGVLSYEFRAAAPQFNTAVGSQQTREIVVGRFVSDQTLFGVSQIRVVGLSNALVSRR